ncbi:hypothetical protein NDU88_002228 [Pleurodeles waltl]|uniref:Uncharacterized protein n=1 Tax=Pleurodeles waltl TaxID=8319 RepID=A0AAV7NHZ2_PLEWA|nr:hypothetical protein NDU88_002228 [Pleurodeles waltl]
MCQPLTGHLIAHGLTVQGGPVTFVVDAHAAYRTEPFYSWVIFPAVDGGTNTFHEYTIANVTGQYRAYAYLEIPLSYQEHHNWLDGALPHTVAQVRLGPLSNDGPTWPLLATYTPYPAVANLAVADVRRLYIDLATTYRRLVQFVMQHVLLRLTHRQWFRVLIRPLYTRLWVRYRLNVRKLHFGWRKKLIRWKQYFPIRDLRINKEY